MSHIFSYSSFAEARSLELLKISLECKIVARTVEEGEGGVDL